MNKELDYTVETKKNFEEAVSSLEEKTQEKGFRVLYIHDVQQTLKEKGIEREPFKILEICNAKFASQILEKEETIGLFLPCKINVYKKVEKQSYRLFAQKQSQIFSKILTLERFLRK